METKQTRLQRLVIEYFQQRPDVDIQPELGAVYRLTLNSDVSRTDFGGRGVLRLTFDADRAYTNPECELITPSHPFLDIVRNDLERDPQADPHLSDGYILAQVLDPQGHVAVPQLTFSSTGNIVCQLSYHPTFILAYSIVYDSYERSENIVRLCYDAVSSEPQPQLLPRLPDLMPANGIPPQARVADCIDLGPILESGRVEIQTRIDRDVEAFGHHFSEVLESEKAKRRAFGEKEIQDARDEVTRTQLQEVLDKDLADLEGKYACRVSIKLLSVLRLWWPMMHYALTVSGHRRDLTIEEIHYDSRTLRSSLFRCPTCGNETQYDICVVGEHVLCAGQCSKGLAECAQCHDEYCPDHGGPCARCREAVCTDDRQQCAYGVHAADDYYCPECWVESFEGRPLCKECLEYCGACSRTFPHEKIATCRLGGERVCYGHGLSPDGYVCQDCGQVTCTRDGVVTADGNWACKDHAGAATCCGAVYANSKLMPCCMDSQELLCPNPAHRRVCLGCSRPVCQTHSSPLRKHRGHYTCDACRRTCSQCPSTRSFLETDLAVCQTCGELVCADHRQICAVGNDTVCQDDLRLSVDLEPLCPAHAGKCVSCGVGPDKPIYRSDRLNPCAICGDQACQRHSSLCPICQSHYICKTHQKTQPSCAGCGRVSCGAGDCRADSFTCPACGMAYCRHCLGRSGRCLTCETIRATDLTDAWRAFLQSAPRFADPSTARALEEMLKSPERVNLRSAANRTYQVVVVRWAPKWYQIWKSPQQIRITTTSAGQIKRIAMERADS
jgi:hypothetical protein